MEELFHINFDGYKTDSEYVSVSKVRLWPRIIATINWISKNSIPGNNLILEGTGIIIINNLSIALEGFVADMVVQKIANHQEIKPKEIVHIESSANWNDKYKYFNQYFEKKIFDYPEFKSIDILFTLRDNLLHGLTHSEETRVNIATGVRTNIKSINQKYQRARKFFVEKGFLKNTDESSNINMVWKLQIVSYLYSETRKFMVSVLEDNNTPVFTGISNELKAALV
ncbi:MAG: hypothetical protein JST86_17120 [Bacteroidetes bacterium]|nr:hypothetical protein [Bacteroidota bacterium]